LPVLPLPELMLPPLVLVLLAGLPRRQYSQLF